MKLLKKNSIMQQPDPKYPLETVNMDDNHRIKDISGMRTPASSSSTSTTSGYGSDMESLY